MTTEAIPQSAIDFAPAVSTEPIPPSSQAVCLRENPALRSETSEYVSTAPFVATDQGFQNQYPLKLWAPVCALTSSPATNGRELELSDIPLNQSAPLPSFDLKNETQGCMAQQLSAFLGELHFDELNQRVHFAEYGKTPIYDTTHDAAEILRMFTAMENYSTEDKKAWRDYLSNMPNKTESHFLFQWSPKEKNALLFFMYGHALTGAELSDLFSDHPQLFAQMKAMNLIVAEPFSPMVENPSPDQLHYRLNDLSLVSQRLPNGETLYLFVDLPARLQSHSTGETSAQLSGTSYQLLHQLMKDYSKGKDYSGIAADFGAGTGIQALALLKMHPQIDTAISLEIDERSMNINRFNALLNGVADRVQVVDNSDPENLKQALAGRQLDLAVSNPPFNTLPHEYEGRLTYFGYGGDHGIDITQLFLKQAIPVLKKNAEFIFYSFLAEDGKNHYYISKFLQESFRGLAVYFYDLNPNQFRYLDRGPYAQALAKFMHQHGEEDSDNAAVALDIEAKLKERGVGRVSEKIVRIIPRTDNGPTTISPAVAFEDRISLSRSLVDEPPERRGGVYIQAHMERDGERAALELYIPDQIRSGERATRGGVYLQKIEGGERLTRLQRHAGGVFDQISSLGGIEREFRHALESDVLKKCNQDPQCAKSLSDALKTFSEKK